MNRISKDLGQYLLTIYHWLHQQKIKIKLIPNQISINHHTYPQTDNKAYYSEVQYYQIPTLLQHNFDNMEEIYQEIRVTSKDKFQFKNQKLQIKLQIGSKFKTCEFQLTEGLFSYEQQIELLLWQAQTKLQKAEIPEHPYFHEVSQLKLINQRHTREITVLNQKLTQQKQKKVELQHNLQQQINQMRVQIFQMKMYYEQLFNNTLKPLPNHKVPQIQITSNLNDESSPCQPTLSRRAEQSSLIYQQQRSLPEIINIQSQNNPFSHIQQTVDKFYFDKINISDIQLSYKRIDQRLIFKKFDNRSRQFNSIVQLSQPISLINFKLLKTQEHNIYVGVLLFDRIRLTSTRRDKGAISYKLKGQLFEDGLRATNVNIKKIKNGQILSLFMDGKNKRVKWYLNNRLMVDRILPFTFNGKQLYPFVNMVNQGDQLEIV